MFSTERVDGRSREDLRQFFLFGVGYAVTLVLGYLLLRKINLSLTKAELGRFSYGTSVSFIAYLLLSLAAPQAYLRFHVEDRIPRALRRTLLPLLSLSSIGVAVTVWICTHSPLALVYATLPFFDERIYAFRSELRVMATNLLKVIQIAVPLLGLYLLPRQVNRTAGLVFALYGLGYLASFLFPLHASDDPAPGRRVVFGYLSPIVVTLFLNAIAYDMLVIVTKCLCGFEASAQVGVATRNLVFIRSAFAIFMMLFPVIYFREMRERHFARVRTYRAVIVTSAGALWLTMVIGAPWVYRLTGASAYLGSSSLFTMLATAVFFDFLFDVFSLYFQLEVKTWKIMLIKCGAFLLLAFGMTAVAILSSACREASGLAVVTLVASAVGAVFGVTCAWWQERQRIGSEDTRYS